MKSDSHSEKSKHTGTDHTQSHPDQEAPKDPDTTEPVEVLVQLAEEGEIDPWEIDVVDATDAFLDRLDKTDLRTSGRALFYAAVLLRMKSEALIESDDSTDDPPEPEPWEVALETGTRPMDELQSADIAPMTGDSESNSDSDSSPAVDPVNALEAEMDRRLERKKARGSPETLDELVRELREAERESWWKRCREYDTSDSPSGYQRGTQTLDYHTADNFRAAAEPTAADVTDTAHGEDIETEIETVYSALTEQYEKGRIEVLYAEVADIASTPVTTYLALLFLSHRDKVVLEQTDLFDDLWIQTPNVNAESSLTAVADDD
ncbi:segregation/condensation protein A [Haloquadratum walsbyi]|uniref:Condensin subunit ScpA n=1 Tax=Haloquadratum walsbyi J07HQW2 TaxID=1238425 RepID=U1N0N5_9EURY|nr:MAG: hypothetical protein J07HQW2_02841 [Haloquadratum walsbyi J07HQW2]